MGIALLVNAIKEKQLPAFLKPTLIAISAGCIGLFTNAVMLFTTYDYSKETIRGGQSSINTKDTTRQEANKGGLDTAYAFAWSYGIGETMTLMVPNVYGMSQFATPIMMTRPYFSSSNYIFFFRQQTT